MQFVRAARADRRPVHVLKNMGLEPRHLDAFARVLEAFRSCLGLFWFGSSLDNAPFPFRPFIHLHHHCPFHPHPLYLKIPPPLTLA